MEAHDSILRSFNIFFIQCLSELLFQYSLLVLVVVKHDRGRHRAHYECRAAIKSMGQISAVITSATSICAGDFLPKQSMKGPYFSVKETICERKKRDTGHTLRIREMVLRRYNLNKRSHFLLTCNCFMPLLA